MFFQGSSRSVFHGARWFRVHFEYTGVDRIVESPFLRQVSLLMVLVYCLASPHCPAFGQSAAKDVAQSPFRPHDPLNAVAFDRFYNLDYDRAVQGFERLAEKYPDDPFAVNHLLTGVLFRELYRMGALNSGEYANDSFVNAPHTPADPKVKQQIKGLVDRALRLEQKRLDANEKDVDALYARGVTRAQFATYTALIERAWFSALRNAVGARHDHEKVLELDPGYTDAKLVVGAHNYVLGSLPWAVKVGASMLGLGGNREKGLQYLKECAAAGGEASTDAKVLLMLFLRREQRYDEALAIDRELVARFPQSSLLALEEGNLLRASDKAQEAASVYRKVWQAGKEGHYPGQHYEIAANSLGDLLRSKKDYAGAASAYELVTTVPQPDPQVKQKASLAAGEMYDVMKERDLAVKKYQEVLAVNSGNGPADSARKFMKEAYRE
jgi:tetratricopeptide (TPR) repeat protein